MRRSWLCALLFLFACGETVDLGSEVPAEPEYATPATILGEAEGGAGLATMMATHQFDARTLVVDATRIYWSATLNPVSFEHLTPVLRSCEKNDCAATLVIYPWSGFRQIAVDSERVYWVKWSGEYSTTLRNDGIVACPIRGCVGSPDVVAPMGEEEFVVDETAVYWLTDDKLWMCRLGDCEKSLSFMARLAKVPPTYETPGRLAIGPRDLYWLEGDAKMGTIMTMPKEGSSSPRPLVMGRPSLRSLTVSEDQLFWIEDGSVGEIRSCRLPDCVGSPTLVASGPPTAIVALTPDGDRAAYWATLPDKPSSTDPFGANPAQVLAAQPGLGRTPTPVQNEWDGLSGLAVDATHVYWTSYGRTVAGPSGDYRDGAVKRIRRPF